MVRHTRWLFLAAIVSIVVFVGASYVKNKANIVRSAPPPPKPLETGLNGRADDWTYTSYDGDHKKVEVTAKELKMIKEPSLMELSVVKLKLYHPDGVKFDLVESEKMVFDIEAKSLYSEGDALITMGVEDGDAEDPRGRLLRIHSSGLRFASDTGKATTDRLATFEFDRGGGSAIGADYDPTTHELHLHSMVMLDWKSKKPEGQPMHAEAGEAIYRENESKVSLFPWSKLTRGTFQMDSGSSDVFLDKGVIRSAKLQMARGVQDDPDRKVEYSADQLDLDFADDMVIQKIRGDKHARLVSTAHATKTTVTTDHLDLDFAVTDKDSNLTSAVAKGNGFIVAEPFGPPAKQPADTRILSSDTITLTMRAGGQEIERAETDGVATLGFLPNRPNQPKRDLRGEKLWIVYGPENQIQSFRAVGANTRTERPAQAARPGQPAKPASTALTESKEILATFDPKTNDLARLEQAGNFRYDEGDRHAQANRASLDQATDLITLDGSAHAQDPSGSINADQIVMNQKTNDYVAAGHVTSIRQPDRKGKSSSMLSNEEILQGSADRMTTSDEGLKIHYEGNAVARQASNRVSADRIDIDKKRRVMEAHGKVVSEFTEKAKAEKPGPDKGGSGKGGSDKAKDAQTKAKAPGPPIFTVVHAPDLVYTEETRVAVYSGGVHLERPASNLTVDSQQIQAFLKSADSDSSLEKAFADGAVKIVSVVTPGATAKNKAKQSRTGTSEHAEYYVDDQKVILRGGPPVLNDASGKTTGTELTLFTNDDRLLVDGKEGKQAETSIHKK